MSEISKGPDTGFWRSLQEKAGTEEFLRSLRDEFPDGIEPPSDGISGISRRRFLQIMSASAALAGLAGCRWPAEKIVPFAEQPAGVTPGKPLRFATSMEIGGVALGLLATSYDGRPIKVDGNPEFPLSLGAASVFSQASVLDLYDPDRSRGVIHRDPARSGQAGTPAGWEDFLAFAAAHFSGLRGPAAGASLAILGEEFSSPATLDLLRRVRETYAGARVCLYEPVSRANAAKGARLAFGLPSGTEARTLIDLTRARVIVDFDANVLQDHPTALRNSKQFAAGRNPESGSMSRLYAFENTFSITGGMADHRFPTAAGDVGKAVWALAAELVLGEGLALPPGAGVTPADLAPWRGHAAGSPHLPALAADLMAHRAEGLLVAGQRQAPEVHALVHVLNAALGNTGRTVGYRPVQETAQPGLTDFTLADLVADLNAGRIDTLIILGGNPVYNAPADLDFGAAMGKAKVCVHLGARQDATAQRCRWHVPRAHYLESWGDARAWDGTVMAVQPLIEPLYAGKTADELLSVLVDATPRTGYQVARDSFAHLVGLAGPAPAQDESFEKAWRQFLHDGFLKGSGAGMGETLAFGGARLAAPAIGPALGTDNLELSFHHDQSVYDGRFADNAWLQELPDFMTKLTWDNAALLSPATAAQMGVGHGDLVELEYRGRRAPMPVYVLPGQARHSVSVMLGYGRPDAGRVGQGAGFDAYPLRTWDAMDGGPGLRIHKTGRTYKLATTQDHHAIDTVGAKEIQSRVPGLVRQGDLQEYQEHPEFVDHLGIHTPPLQSLWKEWDYTGYRWGMAVDLSRCTGCNACIVGCQAENNVAVVGKDEVSRGREMAWIRLDRYFLGDPENPECAQQPVACAHCEMAPCEQVCPVAATTHTREGLNAMAYNRCVGTRYCSNNCPYKVRRFNWFNNFEDLTQTQRMVLNPEVTVRARGVMEKCTYCVQRIETARVDARIEGRGIRDGDITPACAQTCPADAIVFGDLNDPESRVSKLRAVTRSYDLLDYLNIKPRTFYLARIRNPNPAIGGAAEHHGTGA